MIVWLRKDLDSRSLRGNVDRNTAGQRSIMAEIIVVPYVGTWIEILWHTERHELCHRRSLRGNVDRNNQYRKEMGRSGTSFPTWERG